MKLFSFPMLEHVHKMKFAYGLELARGLLNDHMSKIFKNCTIII